MMTASGIARQPDRGGGDAGVRACCAMPLPQLGTLRRLALRRNLVLVAFLLVGMGCATTDPHGRESLAGTVTLHGRPLDAGSIEFLPPDPNQGISARGFIQNGRFLIPRSQGVPPASYRVLISAPEPDDSAAPVGSPGMSMPPLGRDRIPARYNRDSQLTVVVRAGAANQFDFTID